MSVITTIERLFRERGSTAYLGEPVSQLEHALQSAHAAEREGASPALIAAALLHDVGHLLHALGEDAADCGLDDRHEELGERFLARYFPLGVSEPVQLHVAAKRYLCATVAEYRDRLSPASRQSLQLQGGPLNSAEAEAFRAGPHADAAVMLRRWDDAAKVSGQPTPPLEHYLSVVASVCREDAR
jgi:[1-hydroxy-2-(trimethylamino)ethyl]phosphonate dioxygenase